LGNRFRWCPPIRHQIVFGLQEVAEAVEVSSFELYRDEPSVMLE